MITLAIDAMGGDNAPQSVIKGTAKAAAEHGDLRFIFFGNREKIEAEIKASPVLSSISEIVHTETVISSDAKPSAALKKGGGTSMRMAIDCVAEKKADGVVSAGNTGALMALAKFVVKTFPGIERPALASLYPTAKGDCVLLDLGANVECDANNLFQFALLGDGFAKAVLGIANPKVGILNVGSEELKGHEDLRTAANMIRESGVPANFHGFIEGYDIAAGTVNVVVTDGFTGNVVLKSSEGLAKLFYNHLKEGFSSSLKGKIAYLLAKPGLKNLRDALDARNRGGAMLLGLNGVVVKCHGGAEEIAFASSVKIAYNTVHSRLNEKIVEELNIASQTREKNKVASI